jgi:exosome complex RNA-binding protein Rrp4
MVTETDLGELNQGEGKFLKHYKHKQILLKIACAAIVLISGIAIGAGGTILLAKNGVLWISHKHRDAAAITKKISEKYGLNQQQTQQVGEIISKAFEQRKSDDEEMDQKRDAYAETVVAQMKEVLTPEQFERWNKDFQTMREKFKNRKK